MKSTGSEKVGIVDGIPITNLWLLMLYASDLFRTLGDDWADLEQMPDEIPDLVGEILTHFVERRLKRNLSYGYRRRSADLSRVRGKIDHLRTTSHRLLERGQVACRFDEFTVDTRRNRYVRCALERLTAIVCSNKLAKRCRTLASALRSMGVVGEKPNKVEMSTERFGRHDADDRQMIAAAHLVFQLAIPAETLGRQALLTPDKESHWLRGLFERGVGGLYKVALPKADWSVTTGKRLYWQTSAETSGVGNVLPGMITDIILDHRPSNHRTIVDTKFTSIFMTDDRYGTDKLKSGYIYQIYAYLLSQEGTNSLADGATGVLLHPAVGANVDESVTIQGHRIRFVTVDLSTSALKVRTQLLALAESLVG